MTPPLSRLVFAAALALPVFCYLVFMLLAPGDGLLDVGGHAIGRDFVNVWAGPQLAFAGEADELFDRFAYRAALKGWFGPGFRDANWWAYPPSALVLFAPFSLMPYLSALGAWTLLNAALMLGATLTFTPPDRRMMAAFALVVAPAALINAGFGQNGAMTAAMIVGGVALLDKRPVLSGMLFGLLTFKPHLGIMIPFCLVAAAAWRTIAAAAATAVAMAVASALLFGFDPWRFYLATTVGFQREVMANARELFAAMTPTIYHAVKPFAGMAAAGIAQAVVSAICAPLALLAFRRARDAATRALVLTAGTLLILPYGFAYDMAALTAATVWWAATRTPDRAAFLLLLPAFVAPVLLPPLGLLGVPVGPFALVCAFLAALRAVRVGRDTTVGRGALGGAGLTGSPPMIAASQAPAHAT